jgi:hypothetical protein
MHRLPNIFSIFSPKDRKEEGGGGKHFAKALSCFAGVEKNSSRNLSMGELFISYNVQLFMFEQHRRSVIPLKVPSSVIKI